MGVAAGEAATHSGARSSSDVATSRAQGPMAWWGQNYCAAALEGVTGTDCSVEGSMDTGA